MGVGKFEDGGRLGLLVFGLVFDVISDVVCHFLLLCWLYPLLRERGRGTIGGMTWIGRLVVGGSSIKVVLFGVPEQECIG